MTLDEFIGAVKERPKGYIFELAKVSGYHKTHVRRIMNGECTPKEQTLIDLVESLEMASEKQAALENALYFNGKACGICDTTLRYVRNLLCVDCVRRRTKKHFYKKRGML